MNGTSDYPFLLAIIDTVDARYHIDRNRVYCTGFSQGGFISFGAGILYSDIFAAVAPVSGHVPSCSKPNTLKRPVPVFFTFGTNDVSNVASFMSDRDICLKYDTCQGTTVKVTRPYPSTNSQSVISRTEYTCAQGTVVAYDSIIGGGHEWAMDTRTKVNTTEEVWKFLKQYSLKGSTVAINPMKSEQNNSISASFSVGKICFQGVKDNSIVRVTDVKGRVIAIGQVANHNLEFKNKSGGIYFVSVSGDTRVNTFKIIKP
jgi:hypothetical protein